MNPQSDLRKEAIKNFAPLLVNLLSGAITAVLIIIQAMLLAKMIKMVFLDALSLQALTPSIIQLLTIIAIRGLLSITSEASAKSLSVKVKTSLRNAVLQKITRLGPVYIAGAKRGDLINLAYDGIEALDGYFSQYLPQVIMAGFVPIAILIAVFPKEPLSGVLFLLTAPLIPVFMALIGLMSEQRTKKQWSLLTKLASRFYDTLQGLEVIKLVNQTSQREQLIADTDTAYRKATMEVLRYTFLSAMALELIATISTAVLAVEIGIRLLYGRIAFEPALFILILAPEFYLPLRQLGVKYHASMTGIQAAKQIFTFLHENEPEKELKIIESENQDKLGSITTSDVDIFPIRFNDVSARYPQTDRDSLSKITFEVKEGEHIALVGATGSGKTTLTYLLMQFLSPSVGTITASDIDIQDWIVDDWRRQVAWVPQSPAIFLGTIEENIHLGADQELDQRLQPALHFAGLSGWVETLPEKTKTIMGERGSNISSGQKQRIALARAFYKNAPLLILDEPTSAVDPILEEELTISTQTLMDGKTVFTIAHRLPTIIQSDRIILLEKGQIVETGSHPSLMSNCGAYARFVHQYSRDYE